MRSIAERKDLAKRDLRHEIESLLASEKSAEAFFSSKGIKEKAKRLGGKPSQSLVGRTLDNYQALSLLGVGGMGEVYRARDTKLGREVAIKVLPAGFASGSDRLRLEREARAVSALNHPNILTIYEIKGRTSTSSSPPNSLMAKTWRS